MSPSTLPPELELAFEPLHKRAFGMAVGVASGLVFFGLTAVVLVRRPVPAPAIHVLDQYFFGYTVSWAGAFVALAWGFVVGFVAGWFTAFTRNLVIAVSLWLTRTRAELDSTRDFMDHI